MNSLKLYQRAAVNAALLLGVLSVGACNSTGSVNSYSAPGATIAVCSGYGCRYKDRFRPTAEEISRLRQTMAPGTASAAAERASLRSAIAQMEQIAQRHLRFRADTKLSYQKNAGKRGEMDCVDESRNTIQYLSFLKANGLLRYHTPRKNYAERGLLFDGRYPHKSATMNADDGTVWAVDSWKQDNGLPPQIMTLKQWHRDFSSNG